MSAVDDILSGLDFDNADGSARLPFLTTGKYGSLLVKKVYIGTGYKGNKFVAELEVLESEKGVADDLPTPVGQTISFIQKLGGASKAAQVGPNNIINFLAAASGYSNLLFKGTKEDPNTGKNRIKKLIGDDNGTMPDGPLVKLGVRVSAVCYQTKSGGGNIITPVAFSILPGYTLKDLMEKLKKSQEASAEAPAPN